MPLQTPGITHWAGCRWRPNKPLKPTPVYKMANRQTNQTGSLAQLLLQGLSNQFGCEHCRFIDNFFGDMWMSHFVKILFPGSRLREFSLHFDMSLIPGICKGVPFFKWIQKSGFKAPAWFANDPNLNLSPTNLTKDYYERYQHQH